MVLSVTCLAEPVNPRLCRWHLVVNDRDDTYVDPNDIRRYPLTPTYGLPKVRCMLNPTTPGIPVDQFP